VLEQARTTVCIELTVFTYYETDPLVPIIRINRLHYLRRLGREAGVRSLWSCGLELETLADAGGRHRFGESSSDSTGREGWGGITL
jgi:hypothetical protein